MALFLLLLLLLPLNLTLTLAQPAAAANSSDCNGVLLTYNVTEWKKIRPYYPSDPKSQPFSFTAMATILNSGLTDLIAWSYLIGFAHRELIVSVNPGVLTSSSPFPYNSSASAGPVSFSGFPNPDLKTPIETANDLDQIQTQMTIVGTLFGASNTSAPLPTSLSLDDPTFDCSKPPLKSLDNRSIAVCCVPNPNPPANSAAAASNSTGTGFLPLRTGDLSIFYDVVQSYGSSYLAEVTIKNESPRARLDNWRLSWEWKKGEFISTMKGAYPSLTDPSKCISGAQGQYYAGLDFSKVESCEANPTILDLPSNMYNDTSVGKIPFCCRNGTILPVAMDPSQSWSAFQLEVYKMPPDVNRTKLYPPQNWAIAGGLLNPTYRCGQPIRVPPTLRPDPSGLQASTAAIATWQVVCNVTRPKGSHPKCCVSFSAFYNDSVVPCDTCACGCPARQRTCNSTSPALLNPPQALLVPFANRSELIRAHALIEHIDVPDPMPCGDNCGVSINWHVNADYRQGWSARVTLFNWEDASFADWFAAVVMHKAYGGFEAAYSFNGTRVGNDTILMQGMPGLNYLVGEADGANPGKDPRVPGKQQTVISFTKKLTPEIDVVAGDGFPSRVFFNGEECSVPNRFPVSPGLRNTAGGVGRLVLILVTTAFVLSCV